MMMFSLSFRVNGQNHELMVKPNHTLLDVLRDQLGLLGTKKGCGSGKCGSCTVLVDGRPVNSCLILAPQAFGREVETIEGLAIQGPEGEKPHPLQEAFVAHGAVQCGFCTPGMILSAKALLAANPDPEPEEIKTAIAGNLCRCTGYNKIVEAVRSCAGPAGQEEQGEDRG